jgi:hypothetical protein
MTQAFKLDATRGMAKLKGLATRVRHFGPPE